MALEPFDGDEHNRDPDQQQRDRAAPRRCIIAPTQASTRSSTSKTIRPPIVSGTTGPHLPISVKNLCHDKTWKSWTGPQNQPIAHSR